MKKTRNLVMGEIIKQAKDEFRSLILRILLPIFSVIFFIYLVIFQDASQTLAFNSIPTLTILGIGSIISIGLILYRKLESSEKKIFLSLYLFLFANFIGEMIFVYQQLILGVSVPYPSVADVAYLSANIFLSYHLYSNLISLRKERRLKLNQLIIVSIGVSIIPIYFTSIIIYSSGISIVDDTVTYLTDFLYYVLDIILLAPSIVILLNFNKNNPFIFHWFSITLGIAILVIGDLGYTYSMLISDEFIEATHSIWNIFYAIAYVFFVTGLFWYIKIKRMLYDKEIDNIKRNAISLQENLSKYEDYDDVHKENEVDENIYDKQQIFRAVQEIIRDTEKDIDILLTIKSTSHRNELNEIKRILVQNLKDRSSLNVRILQRMEENENNEDSFFTGMDKNLIIQNFVPTIVFEAIVFIVDYEYLFVIEIKPSELNEKNIFTAAHTNNKVKLLVYINIFERTWISETANKINFG